MPKTSREVVTEALRKIKVIGVTETAEAEEYARGLAHLEALYAEMDETDGMALEWTIETIPDRLFLHVADMVGGSIASAYNKTEFMGLKARGKAKVREAEFGNEIASPSKGVYF